MRRREGPARKEHVINRSRSRRLTRAAASKKLEKRLFPGSKEPGHIEASGRRRTSRTVRRFLGSKEPGHIEARCGRKGKRRRIKFLGSKEPGHIEAHCISRSFG